MKLLLIIGSIVFSLLALVIVYLIAKQKMNKIYVVAAVYLELIVILCLMTHQPACFGLCGVIGLVPMLKRMKR